MSDISPSLLQRLQKTLLRCGPFPLKLMTLIAILCLPLVVLYQVRAYRALRGRVGPEDELRY